MWAWDAGLRSFQSRRVKSPQNPRAVTGHLAGAGRASVGRISRTVHSLEEQSMSTNIYVGNLAFGTTSADLRALFAEHGEVTNAQVVPDRETGRSRGFGFVEMAQPAEATTAIKAIDGRSVDGRQLKGNIAKDQIGRTSQS